MGLFDSDVKRRLSRIETHLEKQDQSQAQTQVVEAELSSQIKAMSTSLKEYVAKEEVFMREHTRREEGASKEHLQLLNDIKLDIQGIKNAQDTQPKDVALMLAEHKVVVSKEFDKKIDELEGKFTPVEEYNKCTSYIKKHIKFLWLAIAFGFVSYFGNDKLLQLLMHL